MTAKEYAQKVATFDQDRIDQAIARIPLNVNRAGRHYKKLSAKIRKDYAKQQSIQKSLEVTYKLN